MAWAEGLIKGVDEPEALDRLRTTRGHPYEIAGLPAKDLGKLLRFSVLADGPVAFG